MRSRRLLCLCILISSVATGRLPVGNWVIRPGDGIGNFRLGENLDVHLPALPKPDGQGDAAMGHIWRTWISRRADKSELSIYTVRGENDSAKTPEDIVRQIRVTSRSFHTDFEKIGVGSSYSKVRRAFPAIRDLGLFHFGEEPEQVRIYDDVDGGIAFEFTQDCSAIIVHPKAEPVTQTYLPGYSPVNERG